MLSLIPVTDNHIEWLRTQRNRPELYKYFRQDKPITEDDQKKWWKNIAKNLIRLFIVADKSGDKVGYVGFNPINQYAKMAEFGVFIIPEYQHKGYAREALELLLAKGFNEMNLSLIYSDVLDYEGESRFDFYEKMGFVKRGPESQGKSYLKQGVRIPSISFYMMKDQYLARKPHQEENSADAKKDTGGLESGSVIPAAKQPVKRKRGRPRLHPSPRVLQTAAR